jgi:hypothetical protein
LRVHMEHGNLGRALATRFTTTAVPTDNAEGFKQGAQTLEISALVEPWSALCLKS